MSEEQPEESLDDIMASLEEVAKKVGQRPINNPPLPRTRRQPMPVPTRKVPEPAQPAPDERPHLSDAEMNKVIEQFEEPVQVEQFVDEEPEVWVRSVPLPTGWVLPLAALLMCVVVLGGLGLYVWSNMP